ncbi:MAG: uroporphyrinogen-III synthase [Gammaproteobacteria bacterium]|nr:uroporphyrinogen-III synthase [Gammaproteobacteria bacterium]
MSSTILQGMNVLVTRPLHQQQSLCDAIESCGGETTRFPLIEILPLTEEGDITAIEKQISGLNRYQILIFVSSNAARFAADWISHCGVSLPQQLLVIAIGPSTARSVSTLLECPVIHAASGMTSETILALPELSDIAGKRIAIVRGKGGRELLATELSARGATIEYLEVYQRQPVNHAPDMLSGLLENNDFNVITISSGEALQLLTELVGDNNAHLSLIPLIVPSERIAELARAHGFTAIKNANGADEQSMLAALQHLVSDADTKAKGQEPL